MTAAAQNPYVVRLEKLERENAELKSTVAEHARILARLAAAFGASKAEDELLPDEDLDADKYNDPTIKKALAAKYWTGDSFVGKRLSQCSPEYLAAFAKYKANCARMSRKDYEKDPVGNASKAKYADYDEKDRVRALSWARRLRSGWTPPEPVANGASPFGSGGGFGRNSGGFGAGSPFGGGGGFGTSRAPAPPPSPMHDKRPAENVDASFPYAANAPSSSGSADDDISFPHGANARATAPVAPPGHPLDDEDELPLEEEPALPVPNT